MHTALTWLKEDDTPLGDLASRLGYQSEAAFSRAFKRLIGISPGEARRNQSRVNVSDPGNGSVTLVTVPPLQSCFGSCPISPAFCVE